MTDSDVLEALESQRDLEREFVAEALKSETQPKGWPAALVMFHISMWRERLRDALVGFPPPRPDPPPPPDLDRGTHPRHRDRHPPPPSPSAPPSAAPSLP